MTQRRVENTCVHFWTFSPVSANAQRSNLPDVSRLNSVVDYNLKFKSVRIIYSLISTVQSCKFVPKLKLSISRTF